MIARIARLLVLSICFTVGSAHAQSQADLNRARAHFEAGRALYSLGNYAEALREFQSGYQLAPRPQFLLNIGLTQYKLHDLVKARASLTQYVENAPKSEGGIKRAREMLAEIDRTLASQPPPPVAPPPPVVTTPPTPPPTVATPPPSAVVLTAAPLPPPKKSWPARYWWVFPVGAAAIAGIAVGVYFGTRGGGSVDCTTPPLGCLDGTHAR